MNTFFVDKLKVNVYSNRQEMGKSAAENIAEKFKELIKQKGEINVVWAAAPSQNDVLGELVKIKDVDWKSINAFHMDEYVGLDKNAPQTFGNFLKEHVFGLVPFKRVEYLDANASDTEKECVRYTNLLKERDIDVVILGIGENGHIAFNDPHVADFNDRLSVKVVELDNVCRTQQVNDGCFEKLSDVPTHAITLTVPTLMSAQYMFCIVPSSTKANAVFQTVNGDLSESCPASVLRLHDHATLYLDEQSSKLL